MQNGLVSFLCFIFYCFSITERSHTHNNIRKRTNQKTTKRKKEGGGVIFLSPQNLFIPVTCSVIQSLILLLTCKHCPFLPFLPTSFLLGSYPIVNISVTYVSLTVFSHSSSVGGSTLYHLFLTAFLPPANIT